MTRRLFYGFAWAIGLVVVASCDSSQGAFGLAEPVHDAGSEETDAGDSGATEEEGTGDAEIIEVEDAELGDRAEVEAASTVAHACDIGDPAGDAGAANLTDPGSDGDGDFTIAPPYADAPELLGKAGVPRGALRAFSISSSPESIFPGITGPYNRNVTVYVPSQYVAGTVAPFMVVQDGSSFVPWLPSSLDNLINEHLLPPLIAILVDPGPGDGPGSERSLEYDTLSDAYSTFIETEVLPRVERQYGVTLTRDPEGRAAMGWSSGGAAAFTMGWMYPNRYHRILTYSGTFVNIHPDAQNPHGAWEYHEHLIPSCDAKPLRVFLEVGDADNGANEPEGSYRNWVMANQRMAAALKTKGYHYRSLLATGAGHISASVVRQTLPETLRWVWRGYPTQ